MRFLPIILSLALVASSAVGVLVHVCHSMGGVVVAGCDCEATKHHEAHSGHGAQRAPTQIKTQPCCELHTAWADEAPAARNLSSSEIDLAKVAVASFTQDLSGAFREVCETGSYGERDPPDYRGPPIFKRNCSFLN